MKSSDIYWTDKLDTYPGALVNGIRNRWMAVRR